MMAKQNKKQKIEALFRNQIQTSKKTPKSKINFYEHNSKNTLTKKKHESETKRKISKGHTESGRLQLENTS